MKKITLIAVFTLLCSISFGQDKFKSVKLNNPNQNQINLLVAQGIDFRCGADFGKHAIEIEISEQDLSILNATGVPYTITKEDVSKFYKERAEQNLPKAILELEVAKNKTNTQYSNERSSITNVIMDNALQYNGCEEVDWTIPNNFNLGSMGGCLTLAEMKSELDDMRNYSVSNGLNIVSAKQDASPTGQTTWGNPASNITNNGQTYQGIGPSNHRWNPDTIYYVRITGNESSTTEGTKPQMLFTSMIHSREVSALMSNIYFMWYLIENYDTDPGVKELVDNNELYFVPAVNPDGLRWNERLSSTGGGLQRKNLRPNTGSTNSTTSARGVDLNRNFDYFWGSAGSGSSGTPSSDSYRGPSAASEPETQIMVDFINSRGFKTAIWNHSFANTIPHPYGGNPGFVSGREDEMHRWHADMTKFNRYVSGATIFTPANGIADDWMLGGNADSNNSTGCSQNILATTPEHGSTGFWPNPNEIIPIAKRSVRISFMNAYYGGKYAKLHDLTQSAIDNNTNLDFAIERVGQTASNFTLTVTPISSNIVSITSPVTQTGMAVLEHRVVTAQLQLASSIAANDKIEYKVALSNDSGVIYEADFEKYYQPTILFCHNPDINGLSGWTNSGGWTTSTDGYSNTTAIKDGNAIPYANNATKTLTTSSSYNLANSSEVLVQFYTKWDIERNFDFVEIQGSTNGSTWQTLCGNYTKPESSSNTNDHTLKSSTDEAFQGNNSSGQVYDGDTMDNWVMEEITINGSNNSFLVGATTAQFRFRFRSDSENESENYSTTSSGFYFDDFKIISIQIPCVTSVPTNISVGSITGTEATITWDVIPSATYDLRFKEDTASTWTTIPDLTTTSYTITDLSPQTDYNVQVRSKCVSSNSTYSNTEDFTTTQITYCASQGNSVTDEFIGRVQLNTLDNDTTASTTSGYSDFTSMVVDIDKNSSPPITVTKFWTGTLFNEAVVVWIDFNKDGDFDDAGENVLSSVPSQNNVTGNITIPSDAKIGTTRMRVSMKYNALSTSCETFSFGEVEDYTVNIIEQTLGVTENVLDGLSIYPNPFNDSITIKFEKQLSNYSVTLFDISGRLMYQSQNTDTSSSTLNISNLATLSSGTYVLKITDHDTNSITIKKLIK